MTAMTVRRWRRVQRAFTVFRWAEAVTVLLVTLRFAPAAARAFGDFLRLSLSVLLGPRFLFLLGNAIVLLLFFFSKSPPSPSPSPPSSSDDYAAVLSSFVPPAPPLPPPPAKEEAVFEDKEVVVLATRACRRSRSERMDARRRPPELRRSRTGVDPPGGANKAEDDAEEFRRTVEAFIEKQLKFQRQESVSASALAIVSAAPAEGAAEEKE